jgi:hypothetical protein
MDRKEPPVRDGLEKGGRHDMRTLRDLAIERYGSVGKLAEAAGVSRSQLSSALNGHRTCSRAYWSHIGRCLGLDRKELQPFLLADEGRQRAGGGGRLAGSVRCRV